MSCADCGVGCRHDPPASPPTGGTLMAGISVPCGPTATAGVAEAAEASRIAHAPRCVIRPIVNYSKREGTLQLGARRVLSGRAVGPCPAPETLPRRPLRRRQGRQFRGFGVRNTQPVAGVYSPRRGAGATRAARRPPAAAPPLARRRARRAARARRGVCRRGPPRRRGGLARVVPGARRRSMARAPSWQCHSSAAWPPRAVSAGPGSLSTVDR